MTQEEAIKGAQDIANKNEIEMIVYRDPIGLDEHGDLDEPWGYCPPYALVYIAKFREREHDKTILPQ